MPASLLTNIAKNIIEFVNKEVCKNSLFANLKIKKRKRVKEKMNNKEKILVTSFTVFADKDTGEIKSRIGFLLADSSKFAKNKSFKGYSDLSVYLDGDYLEKLPDDLFMASSYGTFVDKRNARNPMRSTSVLTSIEYKGHVYNLS